MKLFRLIFILLGLLLCLNHVWSLTCGTEYNDTASSAYFAEIILVVKLSQNLKKVDLPNITYNATVIATKRNGVLKGKELVNPILTRNENMVTVGLFGQENFEDCIYRDLTPGMEYIMFLNRTEISGYYRISAMPFPNLKKRDFKRAKKNVKKILCRGSNSRTCARLPVINSRKMRNAQLTTGDKLTLSCKIERKSKPYPPPNIVWLKDGMDITLANDKASIKTGRKGSRLQIRKTKMSDAGRYVCVMKNVAGEVRHEAVIKIFPAKIKAQGQKFNTEMELKFKIKTDETIKTRFTWKKDGKRLRSGDKPGLEIRSRGTQSTLKIAKTLLSDQGLYTCTAKNIDGETHKLFNITVFDAPQKISNCTEDEAKFCLNGGVCGKFLELDDKVFCTCQPGYRGERCMELRFEKAREEKLAQDRTFVVVGIISGILLFIGICVVSYFLAKRRRERFYRRRSRMPENGNIEDIPPPNYRPLPKYCDEKDGPGGKKPEKLLGVLIHKEVQTIETCFVNSGNLYISPMDNYDGGNRDSRTRKPAVSLDQDPRSRSHNNSPVESDEENTVNKPLLRNSNPTYRNKPPTSDNSNSTNDLNFDGAPNENMNDLSPKRKPMQRENGSVPDSRPHVVNIPSSKAAAAAAAPSSQPLLPAINLDTDSEEEMPTDGSPLTPLHISEGDDDDDEDNPEFIFKKCRVKSFDENKKERKATNKTKDTKQAPKEKGPAPARPHSNRKVDDHSKSSTKEQQPKHNFKEPVKQKEQPVRHPREQHPVRPQQKEQPMRQQKEQPIKQGDTAKPPVRQQPESAANKPSEHPHPKHQHHHHHHHHKKQPPKPPGSAPTNTSSATNDGNASDSSSTTEGCDSPTTAWKNAQEDFSDHSPAEAPKAAAWNERGSPEQTEQKPQNYFNIFPKMEPRNVATNDRTHDKNDRNRNQMKPDRSANDPAGRKLKNKYTIVI